MLTEKDLINLDFTRNDETIESSGAPNDWHYYTYDVGHLCLISPSSDEIENGEWYVEIFEHPEVRFTNRTELEIFITLLVNNYNEDRLC